MNKYLRYGLIAAGAIVLLLLGAAGFVAATFNPNDYKPQIIQLVKEKKQRTLKLDGDIKLAFFPKLGADLGKLALSEHRSDKEFASVESARVSLALMPLLKKQLVVDEIAVKGARANLVRFKDGSLNIDDLLSKEEKSEQFKFDIDHVLVEGAGFTFRDEAKGAQYSLSEVNLKTGRVANGMPSKVALSFKLQGNQPKISLAAQLETRLTFDLDKAFYALEGIEFEAKGEAAGLANFVARATGDVSADVAGGEYKADKLAVAITGASGTDSLDIKLDAPRLRVAQEKASGDKVTLTAKITNPRSSASAHILLPGPEGTAKAFKASGMTADLEKKQGDLVIKAKLASTLSGNLEAKQLNFSNLTANLSAAGPDLPGKSLSGELAGGASVDLAKQAAQANLSGKVADSNLKAKLGVAGFDKPFVTFDVDIDQLDVDRFLPAKQAKETKQPEQPLDFSALKHLNASGSLRISSLKVGNVKSSQVKLNIKAGNGRLDVNPLSANLYQGSVNGSLALNAAATPAVAVRQNLAGINIGPLLKDLAGNDRFEGKGNVNLDVTAQGQTVSAMKKNLNGTAAVNLANGAIKGINIGAAIRNAKAKLGSLQGESVQAENKAEKTDFSELKATFNIRNGVAHNQDLSMKSPLLRVGGEGDIDIGGERLDYLAKATVVTTAAGQGGKELSDLKGLTVPVRISGPFAVPSYKLEFGSIASELAKQKVEEKKEDLKTKAQDALKGLFKR